MRQRHGGSGVYVMAAAVVDSADAERLRPALLRVRHDRRPFHWREEEPADRRKAVAVVASLGALHLVVIGVGMDSPRQERARQQCLQQLLWRLDQADVAQVWLDQRTPSLNARDQLHIAQFRAYGTLSPAIRADFARPFNGRDGEVLLWLADIVAGAVSAAHGDGDNTYVNVLEPVLELHTIKLD